MEKPIKPKKPSLKDPEPQRLVDRVNWVALNSAGEVVLIPDTENDSPNYEEIYQKGWKIVGYDHETLSYSLLTKIHYLIRGDFEFWLEINYDGYPVGLRISHKVKNYNYEQEKAIYNNRFDDYEKKLDKYREEMIEYEKFKNKKRIEQLENHIKRLKEEKA